MNLYIIIFFICSYFIISNCYYIFLLIKDKHTLIRFSNVTTIAIIFGTRPEIIKLAPVIKELETYKNKFKIVTIFTGQHENLSEEYLSLFNISPSYELKVMKTNQALGKLTSRLLNEINNALTFIKPSLLIVQGDTTSAMTGALSAFYLNIPVAHIEAGLRTYQINTPFPEEMNRQLISKITTYHFAATLFNVQNLNQECLSSPYIYLVGNTVIDSLQYVLSKASPSLLEKRYENTLLFTIHRRENKDYFVDMLDIIVRIIRENDNTMVIYPIHPNPNVQKAILNVIPNNIYEKLINRIEIKDNRYCYFNRLVISKPLSYQDLVNAMNISTLIVTDSGGIQEEAVSLGKKLLILRENTERYEAVYYKAAILVGTKKEYIYTNITCIIHKEKECNYIKPSKTIYGKGKSAKKIVHILLKNYPFKRNIFSSKCNSMNNHYDIIYILTVWKRNNYIWQLKLLLKQNYSKNYNILIVIFQNGNHLNISDISNFSNINININIHFIHSYIETGYFARFLVPLLFNINKESYFFVIDDDIRWGYLYFDNMISLINKGYLATRNGRYIDKNGNFISTIISYSDTSPFLYDRHIEFDFGGHIWGGKNEWLKVLWNNPPPFLDTCEDIWISVVLRTYLGIRTATPKCTNITNATIGEICACDDYSNKHQSGIIGNTLNDDKNYIRFRMNHIKRIIDMYNYTPLYDSLANIKSIKNQYYKPINKFNIIEDMKKCKTWIG